MSLVQDTARAAVDSFNQAAQQPLPAAAPTENMSLIDMMIKGGWIMVPILLLFFIGLVIFFERYLTIRRAAKYDNSLMSQVKANVLSGNLDSA